MGNTSLTVKENTQSIEAGLCPVCSEDFSGERETHLCPDCSTAHHKDCWEYAEGCAIYGCKKVNATDAEKIIRTIVCEQRNVATLIVDNMFQKAYRYRYTHRTLNIATITQLTTVLLIFACVYLFPGISTFDKVALYALIVGFPLATIFSALSAIELDYLRSHIKGIDLFLQTYDQQHKNCLLQDTERSLNYYEHLEETDYQEKVKKLAVYIVFVTIHLVFIEYTIVYGIFLLPLLSFVAFLMGCYQQMFDSLTPKERMSRLEDILMNIETTKKPS